MKNSPIAKFPPTKVHPKPPKELGKHGRAEWNRLQSEYPLDDQGAQASLRTVCRSEDDIQRMREIVRRDGDVILDRFGQRKAHPLLQSIRGAETVKRQALRALNLDIEPQKGK